jgi:uncharacterized protein
MKQTFDQLIELQRIDSDLAMLKARMEELPKRINRLQEEAKSTRSNLESIRLAITDHKKNYKLAEVELKSSDEKVSSYSVQLYSAKTNEQYKAFLKEIETQKKVKSKVEDRMIILMEESEQLETKRQAVEKEAGELETDTVRKVTALETEKQELAAAISEREQHRTALVAALPQSIVTLYERIRKSKAGLAVVTTKSDRCNGCYNPVPAQRLLEVERQDRVLTCEACGRILVPDKK